MGESHHKKLHFCVLSTLRGKYAQITIIIIESMWGTPRLLLKPEVILNETPSYCGEYIWSGYCFIHNNMIYFFIFKCCNFRCFVSGFVKYNIVKRR